MLTYQRLRNLAVLVNAVAFITAVVLGTRIRLVILATHLVTGLASAQPRLPLRILGKVL